MLLQGLSTPLQQEAKREHSKKSPKKKAKGKAKKVPNLTLDEQVKCYARIVVNQLFGPIQQLYAF
jgi:hypothetical protein